MSIADRQEVASATRELFRQGNYAAAAREGGPDEWETYAALGLIGRTRPALEGLSQFPGDEPAFYAAVACWIDGDDDAARAGLLRLADRHAHARNLLNLVRQRRLRVLTQLPWTRSGCSDLLTGIGQDSKFLIDNISYRTGDVANTPYADIHRFYDPQQPPDFYVCQMVEWHALAPNLAELPCPVLGHTADYDLHIQTVHPWLQLFDELVVTDPSEWADVRRLAPAPVSTFPKSFSLPVSVPPLISGRREWDLFLSGTVSHPYHPDKGRLLHQILRVPGARLKVINGFRPQENYHRNLASSKLCVTFVRHPTALPTRGLEALAMGCAVVVQRGSVLTFYVGEAEGVFTYELGTDDLGTVLRRLLDDWPTYQRRAAQGAAVIRREFAQERVASQYFRFLTFLAARPRQRTQRYADGLVQKRTILKDGWLPAYDFDWSPLLKEISLTNYNRFVQAVEAGPTTPHPYLDATRESVLYDYHRLRNGNTPAGEWLRTVSGLYRRGLTAFPRSLPLRFNFARVLFHFGGPKERAGVRLAQKTLREPEEHWTADVMEDVFPWDFFPQMFNYRSYFDAVTGHLAGGPDATGELRRLMLASLHYYCAFFAPYGAFYSQALDHYRQAAQLDPEFPYYQYHYARELLQRGLPADDAAACDILGRLVSDSILFLEAFEVLEELEEGRRPRLLTPGSFPFAPGQPPMPPLYPPDDTLREVRRLLKAARPAVQRARAQIDFAESISPALNRAGLVPPPTGPSGPDRNACWRELDRVRKRVQCMESTKFWKLRRVWFQLKRLIGLPADD